MPVGKMKKTVVSFGEIQREHAGLNSKPTKRMDKVIKSPNVQQTDWSGNAGGKRKGY